MELSTTAGDHVPVIEFPDVFGNVGTTPPEQILNEVPKLNVGVVCGVIVTVKVVVVAHCPASGIKVYIVCPSNELSIVDGFHEPEIELFDKVGNNTCTETP